VLYRSWWSLGPECPLVMDDKLRGKGWTFKSPMQLLIVIWVESPGPKLHFAMCWPVRRTEIGGLIGGPITLKVPGQDGLRPHTRARYPQ
jgi:hypothetical protein